MIKNHFPAPSRKFLEDYLNGNKPTAKIESPPVANKTQRAANLKRKVLADLDIRSKKARIIDSDDSENENKPETKTLKSKAQRLIYSDESDSENEGEIKRIKLEKNETDIKMESKMDMKPIKEESNDLENKPIKLTENQKDNKTTKMEKSTKGKSIKKEKIDESDDESDFSGMTFF